MFALFTKVGFTTKSYVQKIASEYDTPCDDIATFEVMS